MVVIANDRGLMYIATPWGHVLWRSLGQPIHANAPSAAPAAVLHHDLACSWCFRKRPGLQDHPACVSSRSTTSIELYWISSDKAGEHGVTS